MTSQLRILVLSPHSGVAEGLARVLSPDGRYEVRNASAPALVRVTEAEWRPDVVLVDGDLLRDGAAVPTWPVPALVLADSAPNAQSLLARVPSARAWLPTDPTAAEVARALRSIGLGVRPFPDRRAQVIALALTSIAIAFLAATCAWLLIA